MCWRNHRVDTSLENKTTGADFDVCSNNEVRNFGGGIPWWNDEVAVEVCVEIGEGIFGKDNDPLVKEEDERWDIIFRHDGNTVGGEIMAKLK